ncbi:hypothetical protein MAM1_0033d02503 [Mucor ambiguus]|uniref:Uncharacterized protein n=1 Tax=Mucor ambiguus TaxID=91626 RepID=A0A0C9MIV7_9FUNG|nr:hypothetical protein MAM1_0033d02503 [Mucor ambiguus]
MLQQPHPHYHPATRSAVNSGPKAKATSKPQASPKQPKAPTQEKNICEGSCFNIRLGISSNLQSTKSPNSAISTSSYAYFQVQASAYMSTDEAAVVGSDMMLMCTVKRIGCNKKREREEGQL